MAFGVYLNWVTQDGPLVQTVLYLHHSQFRGCPKAISREPAISKFVGNFSTTHTSLQHFSTYVGSVLQCVLPHLQPGHGWEHMVSGLRLHTYSPYSDSASLRLRLFDLTSHAIVTRRFILQKARHHSLTSFDLL